MNEKRDIKSFLSQQSFSTNILPSSTRQYTNGIFIVCHLVSYTDNYLNLFLAVVVELHLLPPNLSFVHSSGEFVCRVVFRGNVHGPYEG